jgi:Cu/Ag efflux pump CusA
VSHEGHEGKGRSRKEILADITALKTVPGVFAVVSGPLADRIGHMMSGVSAPVAIKVFGPDLDTLRRLGIEIQTIAKTIPGFEDAKLDQQSSIPQLRIEAEPRPRQGLWHRPRQAQRTALRFDRRQRSRRAARRPARRESRHPPAVEWRDSPDKIAELPIETGEGQRIPLSLVADVREAKGPNVIFRENSQRRFALAIKPTVQDVGAPTWSPLQG